MDPLGILGHGVETVCWGGRPGGRGRAERAVVDDRVVTGGAPARYAGDMWRDAAACSSAGPEIFFEPSRAVEAKLICGICAVREACLAWADETGEVHGVWGGLTPSERGLVALEPEAPSLFELVCRRCAVAVSWPLEIDSIDELSVSRTSFRIARRDGRDLTGANRLSCRNGHLVGIAQPTDTRRTQLALDPGAVVPMGRERRRKLTAEGAPLAGGPGGAVPTPGSTDHPGARPRGVVPRSAGAS